MKTALKYCAIGLTAIALVTTIVFFFFSAKNFSDVKLIENSKGFTKFINYIYYPTGFLIIALIFIFLGITAIILLLGDERNKIVHIGTCAVGVLLSIWFLISLTGGVKSLKRHINGTATTLSDSEMVADAQSSVDKYTGKYVEKLEGTTFTEEDVERFYWISDVIILQYASEEDQAWHAEAKANGMKTLYDLYVLKVNNENRLNELKNTEKAHKTAVKVAPVYFILSLTAVLGGAAMVVWTYTKEDRD